MVAYQPTWANGREVKPGRRPCDSRYAAIANYLAGRQDFTVLDFGSHLGYFSQRLHEDFNADCTAVDDYQHLTEKPGVTVINERLTAAQVRKLGTFDVTLCLSVLHHVPQWKAMLSAILDSAPIVFLEVADPDETLPGARTHGKSEQIFAAIEGTGARVLTHTKGFDDNYHRPLWVLDKELH